MKRRRREEISPRVGEFAAMEKGGEDEHKGKCGEGEKSEEDKKGKMGESRRKGNLSQKKFIA